MESFRDQVAAVAAAALEIEIDAAKSLLQPPKDPRLGDFALPCFTVAKARGQNPARIAAEAAAKIPVESPVLAVEAAGPYLNFRLDPVAVAHVVLGRALAEDRRYGGSDEGAGKTIVIDFSSPNIAKTFGIHHLRSTVIGAAIGRVLRARGYDVQGVNHLGDWGTQFGQLIVAYRRWGDDARLAAESIPYMLELYVRFNAALETEPELQDEARAAFADLERGDEECRRIWNRFRDLSLAEFRRIYARLDIQFQHFTGESFYEDKMAAVVDDLERSGLLTESQDASVVDLTEEDLGVSIIKKKDSSTLYVTRDLAAAVYRFETFHFAKALYVVGAAQALHFRQLFRILEKLGKPFAPDMVHVPFGLLRFKDRKMSTRKGDILPLEDVLDRAEELARDVIRAKNPELANQDEIARAVGIGAVVFNDLKSRRIKDVVFDWDEVLSFEGDTGPYLQYTHARIASIFRKADRPAPTSADGIDLALLELEPEQDLVRATAQFGDAVRRAAEDYEPSNVSSYLLNLAAVFNRFYIDKRCRIVGVEPALMEARLALVRAAQITLRNGLALLGITAPDEM